MTKTCDVLVIGGGVAGTAAAAAAAAAGARVVMVRAGPGATGTCAGAWRQAPPAPFAALLVEAGHPLVPVAGGLPHPHGVLVASELAGAAQASAALAGGAERALVCGIAGVPSFRAVALARLWSAAAGLVPGALSAVTLTLPDTPAAGWSEVSLAALLEREPLRLGAALAHAVREHTAARVILPAVLGLELHADTVAQLQAAAGVIVGEALGVAPSLPGWRLDVALRTLTQRVGAEQVGGRVVDCVTDGTRLTGATVAQRAGTRSVTATAVVLATGKFLGGGIAADARLTETALGCDVVAERFGRTFSDIGDAWILTDAERMEPQPLLQLGVRTDADGRPLLASGDVQYDNVFVAGSVRAGVDTAALGLGRAAAHGWDAGVRAAACAAA